MFKQGQRGLLQKHVPAAWTIAQKLLASPAAQSSVLARCMVLVDYESCRQFEPAVPCQPTTGGQKLPPASLLGLVVLGRHMPQLVL